MRFLVTEKLGPHKFKTPEGYLICTDAILSRTGKQEYKRCELFGDACEDPDKIVNVERTDDEVFSDKAMASFENKPVCIEHPDHDVNAENHNELAVGFVRDIHKGEDGGKPVMMGTLVITDKDAVEAVESGEYKELSCGYDCDIDDDGEPCQRNIRGNHVALCKQGRAGIARIVDSVDSIGDADERIKVGDASVHASSEHNNVGNNWYGYYMVEHPKYGTFYVSVKTKGRRQEVQLDGTGWNFIKSKGYTTEQKRWIAQHKSDIERLGPGGTVADSTNDAGIARVVDGVGDMAKLSADESATLKAMIEGGAGKRLYERLSYDKPVTIHLTQEDKELLRWHRDENQYLTNKEKTLLKKLVGDHKVNDVNELTKFKIALRNISKMYSNDPGIEYVTSVLRNLGYEVTIDSIDGWRENKNVPGEHIKKYRMNITLDGKEHHFIVILYADMGVWKVKEINAYMLDSNTKQGDSMKDEDFSKKTKQGYDVVEMYRDGGRLHVIFKRANDFGIGLGYDTTDGQWSQGRYDFSTLEKARKALMEEKPYARRIQDSVNDDNWSSVEEENYKKANKPVGAKDVTEKNFKIYVKNAFGAYKVADWPAVSKEAAVKEFLEMNPAYRNKGIIEARDSVSDSKKEQLFTIEYKQDDVTYIRKVRANSIEDAISKVKDDAHKVVVFANQVLNELGKNNSIGKYDRVVQAMRSLYSESLLPDNKLKELIRKKVPEYIKKYVKE